MRLIDAHVLEGVFDQPESCPVWHYTVICSHINSAPTIDAFPVVRCMNCKYAEDFGWLYCSEFQMCVAPEFFCAKGMEE